MIRTAIWSFQQTSYVGLCCFVRLLNEIPHRIVRKIYSSVLRFQPTQGDRPTRDESRRQSRVAMCRRTAMARLNAAAGPPKPTDSMLAIRSGSVVRPVLPLRFRPPEHIGGAGSFRKA